MDAKSGILGATSKQEDFADTAKACTALKAGFTATERQTIVAVEREAYICHCDLRQPCNLIWQETCRASTGLTSSAQAVDWQGSAYKSILLSARVAESHMM